jgi:hypothetical protein
VKNPEGKLQWALSIGVYHDPSFGHRIELWWGSTARAPHVRSGGTWKGLGIPEAVLTELRAEIDATVTEHLVTRYGVAGELPLKWSGEPDPF